MLDASEDSVGEGALFLRVVAKACYGVPRLVILADFLQGSDH